MKQATNVNAQGVQELAAFLAKNHKLGGEHFTPEMLRAWASAAEFQLSEGNGAGIEIPARDSVKSYAVEFSVSDDGLDWAEVWTAWEDGARDDAVTFLVPLNGEAFDVADAGAQALGVDVSERLNVERA